MKILNLLYSLVLCYSGLLVGASEPQETKLEEILREPGVRETLLPYLSMRDFKNLSQMSDVIHELAMEKAAIWESYVLNARVLDLHSARGLLDNQAFKDKIIRCIKKFATDNPGTWINLNLSENGLGYDLKFLKDLLQAIVTTVHSLKIDVASLDLFYNHLKDLPEHLFDGLTNLQSQT